MGQPIIKVFGNKVIYKVFLEKVKGGTLLQKGGIFNNLREVQENEMGPYRYIEYIRKRENANSKWD